MATLVTLEGHQKKTTYHFRGSLYVNTCKVPLCLFRIELTDREMEATGLYVRIDSLFQVLEAST